MGLLLPIVDFILEENNQRAFTGEVLFIGQQQTFGKGLACYKGTTIHTLDQSDYEGADIIWDMGKPVPEKMHGQYDFIYDGGSLDNMFNPAQAIMNMSAMLKPDGRMICMAAADSFNCPYLMFSPGWFHDYYAYNKFKSWKVYCNMYKTEKELMYGPWDRYLYEWENAKNGEAPWAERNKHWLIVTVAEKAEDTTADVQPIQYQYRKP